MPCGEISGPEGRAGAIINLVLARYITCLGPGTREFSRDSSVVVARLDGMGRLSLLNTVRRAPVTPVAQYASVDLF